MPRRNRRARRRSKPIGAIDPEPKSTSPEEMAHELVRAGRCSDSILDKRYTPLTQVRPNAQAADNT